MKITMRDIGIGTGLRMEKVRKILEYTKKQMAARLEIKPGAYYKNENDETRPSLKTLYIMQLEFDISADWLMFNKGPMYLKEKIETKTQAEKEIQLTAGTNPIAPEEQKAIMEFKALKKKLPEIDEMMQMMADDPELRYDMLRNFHKYKKNTAVQKERNEE